MVKMKKRWLPCFGNIRKMEKELSELAKEGYELCDYTLFTLTFAKSKPKDKEYFIYLNTHEKNAPFNKEFCSIKSSYKKRKTKYHLENIGKWLEIVEIDTKKIDDNYKWSYFSRNSYYQKWCITNIIVWSIFAMVMTVLGILGDEIILFIAYLCWIVPFNYIGALIPLRNEKKELLQELK